MSLKDYERAAIAALAAAGQRASRWIRHDGPSAFQPATVFVTPADEAEAVATITEVLDGPGSLRTQPEDMRIIEWKDEHGRPLFHLHVRIPGWFREEAAA